MEDETNLYRNARNLKALSLLYAGAMGASMLLVHSESYAPAVSFVPLYLAVSSGITAAIATLLLPAEQFTEKFCSGGYPLCATLVAMLVFFSGGSSSELYVLFFPLVLVSALHGSWRIGLAALASSVLSYSLAMLPELLGGAVSPDTPLVIFFRVFALALTGTFVLLASRRAAETRLDDDEYELDEDGSVLQQWVSSELAARRGVQVAVILVDPGRKVEDLDLLLERVRARIGEPVLLGEGAVFGLVLSGGDERSVEGAARRALATAASLGAAETRAGAAIYPRDARSPEDLLDAAGRALEAAFEVESPSAVVLAGRSSGSRHRVAR